MHWLTVSDILTDDYLNGIARKVGSNAVKLARKLDVKEPDTKGIDRDDLQFTHHLVLSVLQVSVLFS